MAKATIPTADSDNPPKSEQQLAEIARKLRGHELVPPSTPRTILSWFDSARRGRKRVIQVTDALMAHGLKTVPPLTDTYIDGTLNFELTADAIATPKGDPNKFQAAGKTEQPAPIAQSLERDHVAG